MEFEEKVGGGWRTLHNDELHNLYTLLNIIRVNKWSRACSMNERLDGKTERPRPL
jgi:hypothetical protein